MLMGNKRGRTKKNSTNESQDLDPKGSPYLEERWIGGNVDVDLRSLFPQRYSRIMGGIGGGASFPRSTMVGERGENVLDPLGKKGALYRSPRERAVAGKLGPDIPVHVWTRISAPQVTQR